MQKRANDDEGRDADGGRREDWDRVTLCVVTVVVIESAVVPDDDSLGFACSSDLVSRHCLLS